MLEFQKDLLTLEFPAPAPTPFSITRYAVWRESGDNMAKSVFQKIKEHKLALQRGDAAAGHSVVGNTVVSPGFKQTDDDKTVTEDQEKRIKRMTK